MDKKYTIALTSTVFGHLEGLEEEDQFRVKLFRNVLEVSKKRYATHGTAEGIITRKRVKAEWKELLPFKIFSGKYNQTAVATYEIIKWEVVTINEDEIATYLKSEELV